ncbi:MAG: AAA family ATPase [Oscillochloris sp.]|nr:AAA family ATPase [Oscillochloris sp.]
MKTDNVLSLTRIFLHNWHRFSHHLIDVTDGLYLAGHNGSGKSSVLDAIQLVLIADQTRVRYNSSAQERSARTLDSYVRGKIGEARYLRPGNTVGYAALEFTLPGTTGYVTLGVCVEAAENRSPERSFFILSEPIDPALLVSAGRPLSRRELRQSLRNRKGARVYDQVGEYQDDLRNRLGGLNERFFDLFLRALTFQPIRNIDQFVEQWLLEARPLEVDALQKVVERLGQLRTAAREVEDRLVALKVIVERQGEVRRLRELRAQYALLVDLLQAEYARRRVADLNRQHEVLTAALAHAEHACAEAEATRAGAEEALFSAQIQLNQSEVIRRRDELDREIKRLAQQIAQIQQVYATLLGDLRREAQQLQPLAKLSESTLSTSVSALIEAITGLSEREPPDAGVGEQIDTAVAAMDAASKIAQGQLFELERQERTLRERADVLEEQLRRLRADRRLTYPPALERLRDLLAPVIGSRPRLLCELIEVPDEHWQNAVEAMLGPRRFNIIVLPEYFVQALEVLDRARADERLYDVGLLDLGKAQREARPAQPNSLADQIHARIPLIQNYINTILGDVITCTSVGELRRHRRAVTAEVVVYSEWTVRAIPPERFTPWFIGERAQRSQIEIRQNERDQIQDTLIQLAPQLQAAEQHVKHLGRNRNLILLRPRLDAPLDARPLIATRDELRAEQEALDLSGVTALEQEVERLRTILKSERETERRAIEQRARLAGQMPQLEAQQVQAARELAERAAAAEVARTQVPEAVPGAEELFAERSSPPDLGEAIRTAEISGQRFETQASNELQRLTEAASSYNTRYQFAALAGDPTDQRYAADMQRLEATELPRYSEQITQAQTEAEEELREHVLHRLREQIIQARQKLEWINDALRQLTFHGEHYHFRYQPADDVREYYDLINDSQLLGSGPLFASDFYQRHKLTFDQFYAQLTRTPQTDAESREQGRLVDYRRYLSYDIEITHASGQTSRLSRIMGQTSGGETQTPFYLTIAASFVQLYRIGERNSRPTIRLVAFDEAFSKMDQDRIGATLELFQQFGLQIITATPLERCEYLVPKICTSLVLSTIGDGVWIEPYRNYAARLEVHHPNNEVLS